MINNTTVKKLCDDARLLPLKPGVYLHRDAAGNIIYVGKSRALKNRVSSYFQALEKHSPKTLRLVSEIASFDYIVTDTEQEALILENELIKLHSPKYNIKLKDGRRYPYLKLSLSDDYPRLSMVRKREPGSKNEALYFGPYSGTKTVFDIMDTANRFFRLPTCKKQFPRDIGKTRPCIYKQMGSCVGVCTGEVSKEQYAHIIEKLVLFLKNDFSSVVKELKNEMEQSAERLEFERAAQIRDTIYSLEKLKSKQKIVASPDFEADVFGLYQDDLVTCAAMLVIRQGRICDVCEFTFSPKEILTGESFFSFLAELYKSRDLIPKKILIDAPLFFDEDTALSEYLSSRAGYAVHLISPERGDNLALVKLAKDNAKECADRTKNNDRKDSELLVSIAQLLRLGVVPDRIESYDISNSGAQHTTCGMVVVEGAKFKKSAYKSFNIQSAEMDDYSAMAEALTRRVERALSGSEEFLPLPDLILLDGGKGHVSTVRRVLEEYSLDIPVFGMVKDDYHKTRCLTDGENDISIASNGPVFRFVFSIQEEVHRYSLSRMDARRRKSVKTSSLEKIKGIGKAKADVLLRAFGSLKALKDASAEDIAAVSGISKQNGKDVFEYFHKDAQASKDGAERS